MTQADVEDGANGCPTCGQPWPRGFQKRVCRACRAIISNNHKYRLVPVGPMVFAFEHRNCAHPQFTERYTPAEPK